MSKWCKIYDKHAWTSNPGIYSAQFLVRAAITIPNYCEIGELVLIHVNWREGYKPHSKSEIEQIIGFEILPLRGA